MTNFARRAQEIISESFRQLDLEFRLSVISLHADKASLNPESDDGPWWETVPTSPLAVPPAQLPLLDERPILHPLTAFSPFRIVWPLPVAIQRRLSQTIVHPQLWRAPCSLVWAQVIVLTLLPALLSIHESTAMSTIHTRLYLTFQLIRADHLLALVFLKHNGLTVVIDLFQRLSYLHRDELDEPKDLQMILLLLACLARACSFDLRQARFHV